MVGLAARVLALVILVVALAESFHAPSLSSNKVVADTVKNAAASLTVATALCFGVLACPDAALANSKTAAQISLNGVPPTAIKVSIEDLPVVGKVISGTYTRVDDKAAATMSPSVLIKSPQDKVSAIKSFATNGHLEFDVNGLLATHLDVDVAADEAGVATVKVSSPLIPKLPFTNKASTTIKGGKQSDWYKVTNLGDGKSYYYNDKTSATQLEAPDKI